MDTRVTINIDKNRIKARIKKSWQGTIAPLSEEILQDCNYFCREDQGILISKSQTASDPKNGILKWDTLYAKKVYYTGVPSKDVNPNASLMWCDAAQKKFGADWNKIAEKLFRREMGK